MECLILLCLSILSLSSTLGVNLLIGLSRIKDFFERLRHPSIKIPLWLYHMITTSVSLIDTVAIYLIYDKYKFSVLMPWVLYFLQLFLHSLWLVITVHYKSYRLATIKTMLQLMTEIISVVVYYNMYSTAGYLFIPSVIWGLLSSYLTLSYWFINEPHVRMYVGEFPIFPNELQPLIRDIQASRLKPIIMEKILRLKRKTNS